MCESTVQPYLKLRGLCSKSNLDNTYVPYNPQNGGKLIYIGLYGTIIEYHRESSAWIAKTKSQRDSQTMTTAIARISESSLLLGSYEWTVYNDTPDCSISEAYTKILTLSGCGKNQFRKKIKISHILCNFSLGFKSKVSNILGIRY